MVSRVRLAWASASRAMSSLVSARSASLSVASASLYEDCSLSRSLMAALRAPSFSSLALKSASSALEGGAVEADRFALASAVATRSSMSASSDLVSSKEDLNWAAALSAASARFCSLSILAQSWVLASSKAERKRATSLLSEARSPFASFSRRLSSAAASAAAWRSRASSPRATISRPKAAKSLRKVGPSIAPDMAPIGLSQSSREPCPRWVAARECFGRRPCIFHDGHSIGRGRPALVPAGR